MQDIEQQFALFSANLGDDWLAGDATAWGFHHGNVGAAGQEKLPDRSGSLVMPSLRLQADVLQQFERQVERRLLLLSNVVRFCLSKKEHGYFCNSFLSVILWRNRVVNSGPIATVVFKEITV